MRLRKIDILLYTMIVVVLYILDILFNPKICMDYLSVIFFVGCILIVFWGLCNIKEKGLTLSNIFLVIWFGGLSFDNLYISGLQISKSIVDIYYLFFIPLLFWGVILCGEKIKIPKINLIKNNIKISLDLVVGMLLCIFIVAKIFVFSQTGIRLVSDLWTTADRQYFTIPGLSGLVQMCTWVLLMFIPMVKKRWLSIMTTIIIVLFVFLSASRGDIMRIAMFLALMWMLRLGDKLLTRKNILKCIVLLLIIGVFFTAFGNYRQYKRGWTSHDVIGEVLKSRVDNSMVNWIYGYTAMNYEVLKQEYIDQDSTNEMKTLFLPVLRITDGNEAIEKYYAQFEGKDINGFNAPTFLASFVNELGAFCFIDVLILAIMIIFIDRICMAIKFQGGHLFIMLMICLTIFGNYFLNINMFYSLLIAIFIFAWLKAPLSVQCGTREKHFRQCWNNRL